MVSAAAGIKSDKAYVFLNIKDPISGIVVPTFWELAYNDTNWVL